MLKCCSNEKTSNNETSKELLCPKCKEKGKFIDTITLKSLLIPFAMKRLDSSHKYQFCRIADCPIVYFNESVSFSKDDLTVEVFQKENSDSTPTCYCFGYNRKDITGDVIQNGKSTIKEEVTQYVKDNKCACELRNPQGSCCLGNIGQVAKQAQLAKK